MTVGPLLFTHYRATSHSDWAVRVGPRLWIQLTVWRSPPACYSGVELHWFRAGVK